MGGGGGFASHQPFWLPEVELPPPPGRGGRSERPWKCVKRHLWETADCTTTQIEGTGGKEGLGGGDPLVSPDPDDRSIGR